MSRTRAHRPLIVRILDSKDKDIQMVEVHNHAGRDCDLPAKPDATELLSQEHVFDRRKCHYDWHYTGHKICSCSMCHNPFGVRNENRKNRHKTHIELHKMSHSPEDYED